MFEQAFNLSGVVPNNEAIVAVALTQYGSSTAMIMFAGMIFNILIARFTKFKYIFLNRTSYIIYGMYDCSYFNCGWIYKRSFNFTWRTCFRAYHEYFASFCPKYMVLLTGNDKVALGHFSALGYWLSGL